MGGTEGVALKNIHVPYAKHSSWGVAVQHRELNQVLCDTLEGWGVVGVGRKAQEGGDTGGLGAMKYKLSKIHVFDAS